MTTKDRLIDLLARQNNGKKRVEYTYEEFVDYLIANGVTILPEGAIVLTKEEIAALNEYQKKHFTGGEQVEG